MNTVSRAAALTVVIVGLSGILFLAQGTDPILGTWELNVAKSTSVRALRQRAKRGPMPPRARMSR